jgi:hypothetical protein
VYRVLSSFARRDRLSGYIARLVAYDAGLHLLILELVADASNARERQLARRRFPLWPARRLATALALLHDPARIDQLQPTVLEDLSDVIPGALSLHRPHLSLIQQASTATLEMLALVQGSNELCGRLDEVAETWRPSALIHRDVKWDNVLLDSVTTRRKLTIVDWELAGIGDPAWDVGSVMADYLSVWLSSIPMGAGRGIDAYVEHAVVPLHSIQPAIRTFWHGYRRTRHLDDHQQLAALLAAVQSAAVRLLQTAFEHTQGRRELDGRVVASVQLSNNILREPSLAARQLLDLA